MSDPFDSDEWREWAQRVLIEVAPMIEDSAATVSLVPRGETDIKFAVELGLSIMYDKPIIAVVTPGARVPSRLLRVADRIVEGDLDDPDFRERVQSAVNDVLGDEVT